MGMFIPDESTVALFRFGEVAASIEPSEVTGNVADLQPAGAEWPITCAAGKFGNENVNGPDDPEVGARLIGDEDSGFDATELVANSTRLRRHVTIEAVLKLPSGGPNSDMWIVSRGYGTAGNAWDRALFALKAYVEMDGTYTLRMDWQTADNVWEEADPSDAFAWSDEWIYIAASRRWISETEVEVRYFLNGKKIGTVTHTGGTIDEGTATSAQRVFVVCKNPQNMSAPPGVYIDELCISSVPRTDEEIEQRYRYGFEFLDKAYELVRACLPPGKAYSKNPTSAVQRELMVEGAALGRAWSHANELHDDFLPNRATRALARWERITGNVPLPGDSVDTRRDRVLAFLRKVHGYTCDMIKLALEPVFGLDADDIEIIENSVWNDRALNVDFDGWLIHEGNGSVNYVAGTYFFSVGDSVDVRWTEAAGHLSPMVKRHLESERFELVARVSAVTNYNAADTYCASGIIVLDPTTGDNVCFGPGRDGAGAAGLVVRRMLDGVVSSSSVTVSLPSVPYWIRIYRDDEAETWSFDYNTDTSTTPPTSWTTVTLNGDSEMPSGATVAGMGMAITGADSTLVTAATITFTHFRTWAPCSTRPFTWYVFRDPALGGSWDIRGAQALIDKMKPAHTTGIACESSALECDSEYDLCDRDPLGV